MRHATLLALTLVAATGCTVAEPSADGKDDVGLTDGKGDGTSLTDCEKKAIVSFLNEGATVEDMQDAGVHARAAGNLAKHRDGADGRFGTDDDNLFNSIEEVDGVAYV